MAELQRNHDVETEWLPFELRPEPVPLPNMSGPDSERYRLSWERGVRPLAQQLGVEMRFNPIKPRTRLAHEAAEFAREAGQFEAIRTALFQAYFVDGGDIGDAEQLVEIGAAVGLDAEALRMALADGRYVERVEQLEDLSRQLGVRAVPTVVIGQYAVEGVRPYEVLRDVLRRVEAPPAEAT